MASGAIETLARMGQSVKALPVLKFGDGGWIAAPGVRRGAAGPVAARPAVKGGGGAGGPGGVGGVSGVGWERPGVGRAANLRVVMNELEASGAGGQRLLDQAMRAQALGSAGRRCAEHVARSLKMLETRDRADRAHGVRDDAGMLVSGAAVPNARARRYAASQMTSRGVAIDSAFDETYARQARLEGIAGVGRRAGEVSVSASLLERERGALAARKGRALKGEVESRGARERRFLSAEELIVAHGLACWWK